MPILTAITEEEMDTLIALAIGRRVLEVGSQYGASTVAMAQVATCVWALDHHRGDEHSGVQDTLVPFLANTRHLRGADLVIPVVGDYREVMGNLHEGAFGLVFLDAVHNTPAVAQQLYFAKHLSDVIAVHDYGLFGVAAAVDEFHSWSHCTLEVTGSLAVLTRQKDNQRWWEDHS
jgi:hypothetical protein